MKSDKNKFKSALDCLLRNIAPFNIKMFRDMLVEYDKQVARVEGEDIYLLLGGTGVGKSTTMHFLCGSTMKMS